MSKLHVLLLPAYYPSPEAPLDGPFMRDLGQAISRLNEVTVLAPWSPVADPEEVDGAVRVVRLPRPRRRGRVDTVQRLWALDRLLRRLRRGGRRVDLIHAHYYATGPSAVLAGGMHRLPVVITENATTCLEADFTAYQARLARFAYRRADVVCVDSALHERCLRALQPRARYEVVPPVVDVDYFASSGPKDREVALSRILTVANLEHRKGHHDLIEAVRSLVSEGRNMRLTIVGEGPERTALEHQAQGMPVRLVGSRSKEEIRELLHDADLFALPTLADTFGVSPVEAMAAGVPVVVSSVAGCAELIGPLGAKLVPPEDLTALRDGLGDALDRPADLSQEVVEALRSYCGADAVGERLDAIYRSVACLD
jgi:glycosyltransferase involved in cell wall biosynthesis